MTRNKLTYFAEPEQQLSASFSEIDEGILCKKALVLVAGKHRDNKQRWHEFSEDRLHRIAKNSNAMFQQGTRIPLLKDHNKTQDSVVGDIDSYFEVREITEENLPNPKHKHLIGKLGLFVDNIVVRSKAAIEQAKEGLLSTISPGIDILTDTIREVSFTPTPAIVGLSMFNRYNNRHNLAYFAEDQQAMLGMQQGNQNNNQSQALSFDELEQEESDLSEIKSNFEDLCAKLWQLTQNVLSLPDEILQGLDKQQLVEEITSQFFERYNALIGMDQEEEMGDYQDPRMMMNSPMYPGMGGVANALQGGGLPTGNRPGTAYSAGIPLACFSMAQMEEALASMTPEELAEFGYRQAFGFLGKRLLDPQAYNTTRLDALQKFGSKFVNATRGKINSLGRLGGRLMGNQTNPGQRVSTAGKTIAASRMDGSNLRTLPKLSAAQMDQNMAMRRRYGAPNSGVMM
jgi:hypothetical protein